MAQQRAGCAVHAQALVVRDERLVADQVHRVEPVGAVQDPAHQLPADALPLVLGQDLQPGDEGGVLTGPISPHYGFRSTRAGLRRAETRPSDLGVCPAAWSPDKTVAGAWDVTVATEGTYHAFANPTTGLKWNGHGAMLGYIQYVVTAPAGKVPAAAHLPKVTASTYRSGGVLNELFGLPRDSSALVHAAGDGQYNFLYFGIPGAPQGLYFQH